MNAHYRHFRETLLQKNYTLCGVESTKGTVLVGLAVCHPADGSTQGDQFSRKVGREVSYEHAHLSPIAELVVQEGDSAEYTFYRFASTTLPKQTFHRDLLQQAREQQELFVMQ